MQSGIRKSGTSLIGGLPWGSRFCQFYQTQNDLFEIFTPYFHAGLESNESCIWVSSGKPGIQAIKKSLQKAVPDFEGYLKRGQAEIIRYGEWEGRGGMSVDHILSIKDKAESRGFEGLRLAFSVFPGKDGGSAFSRAFADEIGRHNVISAFAFPRDKFDAIGLMDIVKDFNFALVRDSEEWEVIESWKAGKVEDDLQRDEEKLQAIFSNMSEALAYNRIVLDKGGKPCDFVFLEVNRVFEDLTGLKGKKIIGRKVTEVSPGAIKDPLNRIDKYGEVALAGAPLKFEEYSERLDKWLSVSAFSPHKGYFALIFNDITERKRIEDVMQARLRISVAANKMSLDELLQAVLDEIEAQTNSIIGFYHFVEPDQETVSLQNWSRNTLKNMCTAEGKGTHYPVSQGGVWVDCVRERGPVIHNDYASLPHRKGLPPGHAPVIRELVVPIMRGEKIVAIIGVGNKPADYNGTDIDIASLLGDFSWEIVERKRAEEALQRKKERIELLAESASLLLTTETPEKIVKIIAEKVMRHLDCHVFFNYIVEEGRRRMRLNAWHGIPEAEANKIEYLDFGAAVCGCVARDEYRIVAEDVQNTDDERTALVRSFGIQAYACHPLKYQGETIGTLSFGTRSSTSFSEPELELMSAVADLVATAMARKRAETAILQAKEEWERTFDSVPDLIAIIDDQHRIVRANRAMAERLGLTPGECTGQFCYCTVHGTDRPPDMCPHVLTLADGKEHEVEVHEERLGGDFLVTTTPLSDGQGRRIGSVHIARDITARKAMDRQKTDFLAMVTHDLKSPLTSIMGFAELILEREKANTNITSMVATIQYSGQKLLRMVEDFLTIARMEAGQIQLNIRPEDMGELLKRLGENFRPQAEKKGLTFRCEPCEGLPTALVDRKQMERVVDNLLQNSFNYTPGGGTVTLCGGVSEGEVTISVEDTGTGIPLDEQERIFDRYYRSARTAGIKGTGLGLAIVKAVTEAHGGHVELTSQPGIGSRFVVHLPAAV